VVEIEASALDEYIAIPFESESGQRAQDGIGRTGHGARLVDVFDTQQPLAVVGPRVEIAADRSDQRTEVQGAARRGRETTPVGAFVVADGRCVVLAAGRLLIFTHAA